MPDRKERLRPMYERIDRLAVELKLVESSYQDGIYHERERLFHMLNAIEDFAKTLIKSAHIKL